MSESLIYDESKSGTVNLRAPGGHMNNNYTYFGTDSNGVDYYENGGKIYTKNGISANYYREDGRVVSTSDVQVFNNSNTQINDSYVDTNVYVNYDSNKAGTVNLRAPGGHMNADYTYVGTDSDGVDYYENGGKIYTRDGISANYYRDSDGVFSSDQIVVNETSENSTDNGGSNSPVIPNPLLDNSFPENNLNNQLAYNSISGLNANQLSQLIQTGGIVPYTNDANAELLAQWNSLSPNQKLEILDLKGLDISGNPKNETTTTPSTPSVPYADFDYTFSCDSKAINDELKEKINTAADNIESLIELIYGKIHGMSVDGIWSGESYEAFKSNIDGYKKNLDDLVVVLRGFVKLFDDAKTEAEDLGTSIDKEINSVS